MRALLPKNVKERKTNCGWIGVTLHVLYYKEKARDSEVQLILIYKTYNFRKKWIVLLFNLY